MITTSFVLIVVLLIVLGIRANGAEKLFLYWFTLLLVLDVNQITSTAAIIGLQEVNCSDLVVACLIPLSIALVIRRREIDKKLLLLFVLLFVSLIAGVLWNGIHPVNDATILAGQSWDSYYYGLTSARQPQITMRLVLVAFRLFAYWVIMCAAVSFMRPWDFKRTARVVFDVSKVHVAFVCVELGEKLLLHTNSIVKMAQVLFPAQASMTSVVMRGNLYALQGLAREPSHMAMALFFFGLLGLFLWRSGENQGSFKKDGIWIVVSCALLAISGAFTALVALAVLMVVALAFLFESGSVQEGWVLVRDVRFKLSFAVTLCLFTVVVIAIFGSQDSYYMQKFQNVWNNMGALATRQYGALAGSADALPRMISVFESLRMFAASPLLGIGLGVMNAHTGIGSILANCGLIGTVLWFCMMACYARCASPNCKTWSFFLPMIAIGILGLSDGMMYMTPWLLIGGLLNRRSPQQYMSFSDEDECAFDQLDTECHQVDSAS